MSSLLSPPRAPLSRPLPAPGAAGRPLPPPPPPPPLQPLQPFPLPALKPPKPPDDVQGSGFRVWVFWAQEALGPELKNTFVDSRARTGEQNPVEWGPAEVHGEGRQLWAMSAKMGDNWARWGPHPKMGLHPKTTSWCPRFPGQGPTSVKVKNVAEIEHFLRALSQKTNWSKSILAKVHVG